MIQHRGERGSMRKRAFDLPRKILYRHPTLPKETGLRHEIRRQAPERTKLSTKVGGRGREIVMLSQHQPMFALLNDAARAAKPGVGLRRDKAILRKITRQNLVTREAIVA